MFRWLTSRSDGPSKGAEWADRAETHLAAGEAAQAESCLRRALELEPGNARWSARLGTIRHSLGDRPGAIAAYSAAWEIDPGYAEMPFNMAIAEAELGRPDRAEARYRDAVRLRPGFLEAWFNLACLLFEIDRHADACVAYGQVLALDPGHVQARIGLGSTLQEMRRLEDADLEFARVLARFPDNPDANLHASFNSLIRGDLATGWKRYAYRWQLADMAEQVRRYPQPRWSGEPLRGRRILVYPEQGFGDMLQFVRFVPRLVAAGAHVVLEAPRALVRLFGSLEGVEVIPARSPVPAFDVHAGIMDLAQHLAPTLDAAGTGGPYLQAPPEAVDRWRAQLAADARFRVGIAWSGDPRPDVPGAARIDRRRSLRFPQLAPLAAVPGISWYSLQLGSPAAQARVPDAPLALVDHTAELTDFADTAALMEALDLVITVDTSVIHLAGAIGRPAWVLSRFDGCWRWLLEGEDSPWYPTVRVYRQGAPGEWAPVLSSVAADLARVAGAS